MRANVVTFSIIAGLGLTLAGWVFAGKWPKATFDQDLQQDPVAAKVGALAVASPDKSENGIWLNCEWYFGRRTPAALTSLSSRLKRGGIKYAFFHVRYIRKNGTLKYHFPDEAQILNSRMHSLAPKVRTIAWIFAGNKTGGGAVDLSNPIIRARMVREANWLVRRCHFDGVQWDYEMCKSGDKNFLYLLDETRNALPRSATIATCAHMWMPPGTHGWGWKDAFFAQVAQRVNQMAVMAYDTGFRESDSYAWIVGEQAAHLSKLLASQGSHCRLLVGVPTYREFTPWHNPYVETLDAALRGVRQMALSGPGGSPLAGVALFADYAMNSSDWDTYRRDWLR